MKTTIIDTIKETPSGSIEVRLKKYNDAGDFRYHRFVVEDKTQLDKQLQQINAHIESLSANLEYTQKFGEHSPISTEEIIKLKNILQIKDK